MQRLFRVHRSWHAVKNNIHKDIYLEAPDFATHKEVGWEVGPKCVFL